MSLSQLYTMNQQANMNEVSEIKQEVLPEGQLKEQSGVVEPNQIKYKRLAEKQASELQLPVQITQQIIRVSGQPGEVPLKVDQEAEANNFTLFMPVEIGRPLTEQILPQQSEIAQQNVQQLQRSQTEYQQEANLDLLLLEKWPPSLQQSLKEDNQQQNLPIRLPQTIEPSLPAQTKALDQPLVAVQQPPKIEQSKSFVQILQQRKERLEERYKKSEKIRATIIKLQPIATKKESEHMMAINNLKMAQTAEFLQGKGSQSRQKKDKATQWKQQKQSNQKKMKGLITSTPSPKKKSPQVAKFIGGSPSRSKKEKSRSMEKKSPSLPRIQSRGISQRIMPYNVYNLYQRMPETFKLSSLATP